MGAPESFQPLHLTVALDDARKQHLAQSLAIVGEAEALVIDSPPMAEYANGVLRDLKERKKRIEAMHEDICGPIRLALANARKWFTPAIDASEKAEDIIKGKLLTFQRQEQERIEAANRARREAERKAREEAEQQAAAARARAEEAARKAREEAAAAEAKAKAEAEAAARARAEGDKKAAAEAERRAQAAAAEAAKKAEEEHQRLAEGERKAAELQLAASAAVAPTEEPAAPTKLAGLSTRENWVAVLADDTTPEQAFEQLVAAIAGVEKCTGRRDLLALGSVDMKAAGKLAKALKLSFNVPGLRAVDRPIVASKAG